jgi:predicted nucleic acid-binding protein
MRTYGKTKALGTTWNESVATGELRELRGRRVLLDTSIWIYHLEANPEFGDVAGKVIAALERGVFRGALSELSLMELLVMPLRLGRVAVADEYELLLTNFPNLTLYPVSRDVLIRAAAVRAGLALRAPDSILLATAADARATMAITNDKSWQRFGGLDVRLLSEMH